ncbi:YeeE/YedE family protein [Gammaproteobacteria bacterium]|nr:YeeE/YedE family protein [Gammaproteobacteria bacterium]
MSETFLMALTGGICIGLAAVFLMVTLGRIGGISGIVFSAVKQPVEHSWAILFLAGVILGTSLFHFISGHPIPTFDVPIPLMLAGGFIVGVGTKMGSGCTSGHGICGISRLSVRSIIATCTFLLLGFITVYLRLHGSVV